MDSELLKKWQAMTPEEREQLIADAEAYRKRSKPGVSRTIEVKHFTRPEDFLSEKELQSLADVNRAISFHHNRINKSKAALETMYRIQDRFFRIMDQRIRKFNQYKPYEEQYPQLPVGERHISKADKADMLDKQLKELQYKQRQVAKQLLALRKD